jgi:hypothetical protein
MSKGIKQEKLKQNKEATTNMALDKLSTECSEFLVGLLVRFYDVESSMTLEMKYIQYGEESISKFKTKMKQRMMEALYNPIWMDEMLKSGYQNFLDKMAHDSIWNAKNILFKYKKTHGIDDAAFKVAILRAELFIERLQPFTKSGNQSG